MNIQFNRSGEAFCINLGFADPERRNVGTPFRDHPPPKLRVAMTGGLTEDGNHLSSQWRLGAQPLGGGLYTDSWFAFAPGQYGSDRSYVPVEPDELARRCVAVFDDEAETWWEGRRRFAASV